MSQENLDLVTRALQAQCFCGCGRDITGFANRGLNKQGRRTVGLLAKLREARGVVVRGGPLRKPRQTAMLAMAIGDVTAANIEAIDHDNPIAVAVIQVLDDLVNTGEGYERFWVGVLHDDDTPPPTEARRVKKDWNKWGREGMGLCRAIGVQISRRGVLSGEV